MSVTYEQRRILHENLKQLVKSEYEQVFRILKKYNEPYTENSNGIFFDVTNIQVDTYNEIRNFLDFCIENRSNEQARISELATLRTEVNSLLEHSVSSEVPSELKAVN
jgi:hypothetical protein